MREEHEAAIAVLKRGGLLLYPTDTVWAIGCDATHPDAIDRIHRLKQKAKNNGLICLVSDFRMLQQYVEDVPEVAYDILKYAAKPTTIIYDEPIRVAENLIAPDNTLGIRVCRNKFCNILLKKFKRPIVSTSANFTGAPTPKSFKDIDPAIIAGVDYVVNIDRERKSSKPSAIIKLSNDGKVTVIRE
jgi:L-threonylcarbamoyladenylate synthase